MTLEKFIFFRWKLCLGHWSVSANGVEIQNTWRGIISLLSSYNCNTFAFLFHVDWCVASLRNGRKNTSWRPTRASTQAGGQLTRLWSSRRELSSDPFPLLSLRHGRFFEQGVSEAELALMREGLVACSAFGQNWGVGIHSVGFNSGKAEGMCKR